MTDRTMGKDHLLSELVRLRKDTGAAERKFESFFNLSIDMFSILDFNGNLVLGNPVFFQTICKRLKNLIRCKIWK